MVIKSPSEKKKKQTTKQPLGLPKQPVGHKVSKWEKKKSNLVVARSSSKKNKNET